MSGFHHIPILRDTVVSLLEPKRGGIFVDGTLGGGGNQFCFIHKNLSSILSQTGKTPHLLRKILNLFRLT